MADRDLIPLTREVLPPQKPGSGLGVLMVASLAMFFAVASSAFVLHARVVRHHCPSMGSSMGPETLVLPREPQILEWHEPARVTPIPQIKSVPGECGAPVYRPHPDGSISVDFTACPDDEPLRLRSPAGVKVINIR